MDWETLATLVAMLAGFTSLAMFGRHDSTRLDEKLTAQIKGLGRRMDGLDSAIEKLAERMNSRFDRMDLRIDRMEERIDARIGSLDDRVYALGTALRPLVERPEGAP